jgi:hypothetical protein
MKNLLHKLIKTALGRTILFGGVLVLSSGSLINLIHHYLIPGPVSAASEDGSTIGGYASHAEFEQECSHCHAPVHCITDDRCQSCHVEIAEQRAEAIGLHGLLPGTERCQTCHVEHRGREAVISAVAFANVDHEALSGFNLDKHKNDYDSGSLNCESCHTQGSFGPDTVDCATCHAANDAEKMAEHQRAHGTNCAGCHDGLDSMLTFDHSQAFPLVGKHDLAGCVDCHADQIFAGTVQACSECHFNDAETIHTDSFGTDCARCHTPTAWTPAQLTKHTFLLDHGDEGQLECQTCHISNYYEPTCTECHSDEDMVGAHQAASSTAIQNCAECHPTGAANEATSLGFSLPVKE